MVSGSVPRLPQGKTQRAIVRYLRDELPRTVPTHEIARVVGNRLGVTTGTVRKALTRVVEHDPPPVLRVERGWYRAWLDPEDLARIEKPLPHLHAIQLRSTMPQNRGLPPRGGQATFAGSDPGPRFQTDSKQWHDRWAWRGRKVTVQLSSTTGTLLVSLNASDQPIEPGEFSEFTERLAGWCQAHGLHWDDRLAEVVTLELNQDYADLSVSEFRRARLRTFKQAWVQVYQKAQRLMRMELRVAPDGGVTAGELGAFMEALVRLTHGLQEEERGPGLGDPDRAGAGTGNGDPDPFDPAIM